MRAARVSQRRADGPGDWRLAAPPGRRHRVARMHNHDTAQRHAYMPSRYIVHITTASAQGPRRLPSSHRRRGPRARAARQKDRRKQARRRLRTRRSARPGPSHLPAGWDLIPAGRPPRPASQTLPTVHTYIHHAPDAPLLLAYANVRSPASPPLDSGPGAAALAPPCPPRRFLRTPVPTA